MGKSTAQQQAAARVAAREEKSSDFFATSRFFFFFFRWEVDPISSLLFSLFDRTAVAPVLSRRPFCALCYCLCSREREIERERACLREGSVRRGRKRKAIAVSPSVAAALLCIHRPIFLFIFFVSS